MTFTKNFDKEHYAKEQQDRMKEIQERIKNIGKNFEVNPDLISEYYEFASQFYNYSPNNIKLILSQNPYATFIGSFKSYKDKGYSVKKGEEGLKILVPVTVTLFQSNGKWVKISEASPSQKKQIKNHEIETETVQRFKIGTVFDISQTTIPKEMYPKFFTTGYPSQQHAVVYEGVKEYCEKELHCPVSVTDLRSISLYGHYIPSKHIIELNNRLDDSRRLEVLLHEMSHAILHQDQKENSKKFIQQIEFEADSLAIMMQNKFGFELSDSSKRHLSGQFKVLSQSKDFNFDDILKNVSEYFKKHIDPLTNYVESNLQLQENKPLNPSHSDKNTIQDYCRLVSADKNIERNPEAVL